MNTKEDYNFDGLVNEAERLVIEELDRQLRNRTDVCTCQECALDIAAYALNNIKPYYRVSLMGSLYASSIQNTDYAAAVQRAVAEAIEKIKNNPSHD